MDGVMFIDSGYILNQEDMDWKMIFSTAHYEEPANIKPMLCRSSSDYENK
jgi:hypothetical protein